MKTCLKNCRLKDKIVWSNPDSSYTYVVSGFPGDGQVLAFLFSDPGCDTIFNERDLIENEDCDNFVISKIIKHKEPK